MNDKKIEENKKGTGQMIKAPLVFALTLIITGLLAFLAYAANGGTLVSLIESISSAVISVFNSSDEGSYTYTTADGTWEQIDEKTWGMDKNSPPDGVYDIVLERDGNVWTYSFSVYDTEAKYYASEKINADGSYTLTDEAGNEIAYVIIEDGTGEVTLYNVKDGYEIPKFGSLLLTKTVRDTDGGEMVDTTPFRYEIALSFTPSGVGSADITPFLSGTRTYGDLSFTWSSTAENGTTTYTANTVVYLKAGESVNLSGIPEGVSYEITEDDSEGYTAKWSDSNSGTITAGTSASIICTNTKDAGSDTDTGTLRVKKTVINGTEEIANDEFEFTAAFFGLKTNTVYHYTISGTSYAFVSLSNGSASVTFSLMDGESASFAGLDAGCQYQIIESGKEDYTASYSIEGYTNVVSSKGSNYSENEDLSTRRETLDKDEKATITFTNTLPEAIPEGDLTSVSVSKVWNDGAGSARPESITIYLMRSIDGDDAKQGDVIATATIFASDDEDWSYTFSGLDKYSEAGDLYYYYIREASVPGYKADVNDQTVYSEDEGTSAFSFTITNTPPAEWTPVVTKTLEGATLSSKQFTFTITAVSEDGTVLTGDDAYTQKAYNDKYGDVSFDTILFSKEGTYYYRIKEVIPSNIGAYSYDESIWNVIVTVTDEGDETLSASAVYARDGVYADKAGFTNSVTKTPDVPDEPAPDDKDKDKEPEGESKGGGGSSGGRGGSGGGGGGRSYSSGSSTGPTVESIAAEGSSAQTGDTTHLDLFVLIMILSAIGMIGAATGIIGIKTRRRNKDS